MRQKTFYFLVIIITCFSCTEKETCNFQQVNLRDFELIDTYSFSDSTKWYQLKNSQRSLHFLKLNDSIYQIADGVHESDLDFDFENDKIPDNEYIKFFTKADNFFLSTVLYYVKDSKYVYDNFPSYNTRSYKCNDDFASFIIVDSIIIKNSDPESFNYLNRGYSMDKSHYYYDRSALINVNISDTFYFPKFKIDDHPGFLCVGDSILYDGKKIAEAKTFYWDFTDSRNNAFPFLNPRRYVFADKNKKWLCSEYVLLEEISY